jgi:Fe-S cluster assembly iron-binding protein IscA
MLNVTNAAKEKFTEFLADEGKKDAYIRIYVSGVG